MDGKKNVNIWKTLQKVPAGTMFVPLIIGALITTVCQGMLHFDLWATLGNPMQDMFSSSGQMLLIGLMLFCTGTSGSVTVCQKKAGGVSAVTCVSSEYQPGSSEPARFWILPRWAYFPAVITG